MTSKAETLRAHILPLGKVAVALSGGLDSSALLAFCAKTFESENCVAFVAQTPYMPAREQAAAREICRELAVECVMFDCGVPETIADNPPERCYLCKTALFSKLKYALPAHGATALLDGTNADDLGDYRPGMRALKELEVRSPFLECGWGKADIRALYAAHFPRRAARIPAPNACLLTRLPHGMRIDVGLLERIDQAEDFLREKGFEHVRVRMGGDGARIEIEPEKLPTLLAPALMQETTEHFKRLGFDRISMDPKGYRRGSMNAAPASH